MTYCGEELQHSKQRFYIPPKLLHVLINSRDSNTWHRYFCRLTLYSPETFKVEPRQRGFQWVSSKHAAIYFPPNSIHRSDPMTEHVRTFYSFCHELREGERIKKFLPDDRAPQGAEGSNWYQTGSRYCHLSFLAAALVCRRGKWKERPLVLRKTHFKVFSRHNPFTLFYIYFPAKCQRDGAVVFFSAGCDEHSHTHTHIHSFSTISHLQRHATLKACLLPVLLRITRLFYLEIPAMERAPRFSVSVCLPVSAELHRTLSNCLPTIIIRRVIAHRKEK